MEPSESELLQMLEARERQQAASWQGLRKKATKAILIGIVAAGAIAMAIPSSRDLLITLVRELPKEFADQPPAGVAAGGGAARAKSEGVKSPEELVKQAAAIGAHATGGEMPNTEDLAFGVELLNFVTGPKQEAAPAPPKPAAAPPAAPPKVAGVPGAKP